MSATPIPMHSRPQHSLLPIPPPRRLLSSARYQPITSANCPTIIPNSTSLCPKVYCSGKYNKYKPGSVLSEWNPILPNFVIFISIPRLVSCRWSFHILNGPCWPCLRNRHQEWVEFGDFLGLARSGLKGIPEICWSKIEGKWKNQRKYRKRRKYEQNDRFSESKSR